MVVKYLYIFDGGLTHHKGFFYPFPPVVNLFQNVSTQIARNSHYFYSELRIWSITYVSL